MTDTIPFTFRLDVDLKRKLDLAAAADFRSTASLLNSIIARHFAATPAPVVVAAPASNPEPSDEPEVTYVKPPGRPRSRSTSAQNMKPIMPAFNQWLDRLEDREEISPEDVATGFVNDPDADEPTKFAAARNLLAAAGYEQWTARYQDGTETEIWRIIPKNP